MPQTMKCRMDMRMGRVDIINLLLIYFFRRPDNLLLGLLSFKSFVSPIQVLGWLQSADMGIYRQ